MPEDDDDRPKYLIDLALGLSTRYSKIGTVSDIEDAVHIAYQGLGMTPNDHPDRPKYLSFLRSLFNKKYLRLGVLSDLEKAIQLAREALNMSPNDEPSSSALFLINLGIHSIIGS
ncbi:uncharacterized protein BCR38DRAFT_411881 [Pseudomassariella vexata]|uniref:Uncharacterized protein n=1 Tax=Pseudomassariella vexata TaxID=1141098 RepID=A0A1Y2DN88_9PEZI|nr:uncharacterized protein BCR38DRAFT_411881 [Pseudomassariella vexata]ORY60763.1 hypothetical protein BCR38DRAFT_411881 [Pseudomassariella vexata]